MKNRGCTHSQGEFGHCQDICLLKKLKLLKPSEKKKEKKELKKNKRIKKNFKVRRRQARRRRRAKRRLNKMKRIKFDEEMLNQVKQDVLLVLNQSSNKKKKSEKTKSFKTNMKIEGNIPINIRIPDIRKGNIREIKTTMLGKRSHSIKSIESTDGEGENDGFTGKDQYSGKGGCSKKGGCCSWQTYRGNCKSKGVIKSFVYDISPVEGETLSQDCKRCENKCIGKGTQCKNLNSCYKDTIRRDLKGSFRIYNSLSLYCRSNLKDLGYNPKPIETEEAIITFNKKYAEEKKGKFCKKMKNNLSFVFECQMQHSFVLSKKQIINGKWCKICSKIVSKLRRKVTKENLKILNFNGSDEFVEKTQQYLSENISQCKDLIEMKMIQDKVEAEVQERKNLESRFQRWRRRSEQTKKTEGKEYSLI
jgi:hypothetical protein